MNTQLKNRKIILGVTGGIAAYKSCTLCRLLIKAGADVYVCMTEAATQLVGKSTFEAISGHSVSVGIFDGSKEISHISLAGSADMVIIAPATANTIAKISAGLADNMITAVTLAATCPVVVAPAMNTNMYRNPATQENINTLLRRGIFIVPPASGDLACGTSGEGRMKEPEEVFEYICSLFANRIGTSPKMIENNQVRLPSPDSPLELTQTKLLPKSYGVGFKVLITAGPTEELIDPVRFISNKSSGKMGFALAKIAADLGADVTLISGPVNLDTPAGVRRIDVKTAVQMLQAVESHVCDADIFIGTAAVADYRAENISPIKIKKSEDSDSFTLKLVKNPDIIATVGKREAHRPYTVGFAAETNNCESNAKEKLIKKHLDLVVLNDVSRQDIAFDSNDNEVFVFDKDGQVAHFEKQPKVILATYLMELIFKAAKK